eukprot:gene8769-9503_t
MKILKPFLDLLPLYILNRIISIKEEVTHYLDYNFYNLTTIALHDWRTYSEMRSLAYEKYNISLMEWQQQQKIRAEKESKKKEKEKKRGRGSGFFGFGRKEEKEEEEVNYENEDELQGEILLPTSKRTVSVVQLLAQSCATF